MDPIDCLDHYDLDPSRFDDYLSAIYNLDFSGDNIRNNPLPSRTPLTGRTVAFEPPVILRPRFENGVAVGHEKIVIKLEKPPDEVMAPMLRKYHQGFLRDAARLNREIVCNATSAVTKRSVRRKVKQSPDASSPHVFRKVEEPELTKIADVDTSCIRMSSKLKFDCLFARAEQQMLNRSILESPSHNLNVKIINTTTAYYSLCNSLLDGDFPFDWRSYARKHLRPKLSTVDGLSLTSDFRNYSLPFTRLFSDYGPYRKRNRRTIGMLDVNGVNIFHYNEVDFPGQTRPARDHANTVPLDYGNGVISISEIQKVSYGPMFTSAPVEIALSTTVNRETFLSMRYCNGVLTQLQKWIFFVPWRSILQI